MPAIVLASCLCPVGIEATFFALFMSILDVGELLSEELGAFLTHLFAITPANFTNLWWLVLITKLGHLLPLLCLPLIPDKHWQQQQT
jgi:hypothetical protein